MSRAAVVAAALVALVWALAGCGSDKSSTQAQSSPSKSFTLGISYVPAKIVDWGEPQRDVALALAKQRGWKVVPLALDVNDVNSLGSNADIWIQKKVDAVVGFTGSSPVAAKKLESKGIPVISYDVPQGGWYFVGASGKDAGRSAGTSLGELAKQRWDCKADLVIAAGQPENPQIDRTRTGGAIAGVQEVCPNITDGQVVEIAANGDSAKALQEAKNVLATHQDAKRVLVVGLNDPGVVGALEAVDQSGTGAEAMGWGEDGSLLSGPNVNPSLKGSVFFWLEGYPVYAFRILDKIADGKAPAMKDTSEDPAETPKLCSVSASAAKSVPSIDARVEQLEKAAAGTTAAQLFCPTGDGSEG